MTGRMLKVHMQRHDFQAFVQVEVDFFLFILLAFVSLSTDLVKVGKGGMIVSAVIVPPGATALTRIFGVSSKGSIEIPLLIKLNTIFILKKASRVS
ncbi:hypothetical protein [Gottfriedia acidiceleris]|uniref:Uncharacterized protein n=1 Tax=Gottfriedia acidiceleris TaxID=371036 RepID=A0ABY4JP65_9BACI|nr:hypothetical protein [Gottfriedia acidiceleris]UPM54638.1 hypothetical protein MY490_01815 [Gottfriedia acidiceleris]